MTSPIVAAELANLPHAEGILALQLLRTHTDEAIAHADAARKEHEQLAGACVNWADLKCQSAYLRMDDSGDITLAVLIDEGDPANWAFCSYIAERLSAHGWGPVEVSVEW